MTGYNRVFLDTTPLIYFLDDDPHFGDRTRLILEEILSSGRDVVSSVITCTEYLVYPYRTDNRQKIDAFFEFIGDCGVDLYGIDVDIARRAAEIRAEYRDFKAMDALQLAAAVHAGIVDPSDDNMLKITSDGRKLGLDQRIINQMLPDEPGTKVNQCVDNIMQIWRDGEADKLTQLVFCDISTPQAKPAKKVAKALDNPTLHALEDAVPLPEPEPAFTVYEDIRQKLIAKGVPADQIAFIHEANTEVRKKELFSKVRTGQVRVLLGSTAKMGAGTNVQDRLVALHDLDCPWRPGDLAQRKGRIERQGNQNETVHVFRYVTEGTFDAYLWQTVENKQKFISQIMTSKSPVRSCDDVDETALSFAEIKALCAGDPRIKERMDLDVDVARLKLMKADHQSKQYRLEDQLLKTFPEEIEKNKGFIAGLEADMKTLAEHPHPEDGFAGMEVRGDTLTDKENAGAALLASRPAQDESRCMQCGRCAAVCPAGALVLDGKKLRFDYSKCIRCYCCHEMCPFDAIVFREGALMRVFKALGLARR